MWDAGQGFGIWVGLGVIKKCTKFLAVEGFSGSAVVGLHESGIRRGFRLLTLGS